MAASTLAPTAIMHMHEPQTQQHYSHCTPYTAVPQLLTRAPTAMECGVLVDQIGLDPEIAEDIHTNMRLREATLPLYRMRSPHISKRPLVVEQLYNLCLMLKYSSETFYTALSYYDNFSDRVEVPIHAHALTGLACLLLAAKWAEKEEDQPSWITLVKNVGMVHELKYLERAILDFKGWNLTTIVPLSYTDMYAAASMPGTDITRYADGYAAHEQLQLAIQRILFFIAQDASLQVYVPSSLAAAAVVAGRVLTGLAPYYSPGMTSLCAYSPIDLYSLVERVCAVSAPRMGVSPAIYGPRCLPPQ